MKISEVINVLVKKLTEDGDKDISFEYQEEDKAEIVIDFDINFPEIAVADKKEIRFATPEEAYNYVIDFGRNFPEIAEAEDLIAQDPYWANRYAYNVIHGRWIKAEATIAKSAEYSCWYARNSLQQRFPEGESAIAKEAHWSYWYAKDVVHGRFLEGEAAIFKSKFAGKYVEELLVNLSKTTNQVEIEIKISDIVDMFIERLNAKNTEKNL